MGARKLQHDATAETVLGYIHTHADCPHCNEPVEIEGDAQGETIECDACGKIFNVGEVR